MLKFENPGVESVKCIGGAAVLFWLKAIAYQLAAIAQLGERQTEDLKVPGSIPGGGIFLPYEFILFLVLRNKADVAITMTGWPSGLRRWF